MPTLTIPACGYSVGSGPDIDDGIERVTALGGTMRGFSNYDAIKRTFTLVFELCTFAEAATIIAEYETNRLTGGMTITPPWVTSTTYTCDYLDRPQVSYGSSYAKVTLKLREQ